MKRLMALVFLLLAATANAAISVTLDTSEAEAVLRIADAIAAKGNAPDDAWTDLFATAGYRDLKARESAMKREFTDAEFRAFVASEDLVKRRDELRRTLAEWKRFDMTAAAKRALEFLPPGSTIETTVYPLIKPKPNSFVFRAEHGKVIVLFLDPAVSGEQFENTVVHEMHHIGFGTGCTEETDISSALGRAHLYLGGFSEGIAVLAAAGGASVHPHAISRAEARNVWDRDVKKVPDDMKRLEKFFLDLATGRLVADDEVRSAFMSFIATDDVPQGAFYTVGWHMASAIETAFGRGALIGVMCDRIAMMRLYNEVVANDPAAPKWSAGLLKTLDARPSS